MFVVESNIGEILFTERCDLVYSHRNSNVMEFVPFSQILSSSVRDKVHNYDYMLYINDDGAIRILKAIDLYSAKSFVTSYSRNLKFQKLTKKWKDII